MAVWFHILGYAICAQLLLLSTNVDCAKNMPHARPGTGTDTTFNILSFGASTSSQDNSNALLGAWKAACSAPAGRYPKVSIPVGKFVTKAVEFSGNDCNGPINVQIMGELMAPNINEWSEEDKKSYSLAKTPPNRSTKNAPHKTTNSSGHKSSDHSSGGDEKAWITFSNVKGLTLNGNGIINGNGEQWWAKSCKRSSDNDCNKRAPTMMEIHDCTNVWLSHLTLMNPPQMHLVIMDCKYVTIEYITIRADAKSPNTDGIHLSHSSYITIIHADIQTGDDCISIVAETFNVYINDTKCGPGHGISIGSLGENGNEASYVSNVTATNNIFTNSDNGYRIKTYEDALGEVSHLLFENTQFKGARNPLIVDQFYADKSKVKESRPDTKRAIKITDVQFLNMMGSSDSKVVVNIDSSDQVPCTNVSLKNIEVKYADGPPAAACSHAFGTMSGQNDISGCLK